MNTFKSVAVFPYSKKEIWDWYARPGTFDRLKPIWVDMEVVRKDSSLSIGSKVHLKLKFGPFKINWILEHVAMEPYQYFTDSQIKGPFALWEHRHSFEDTLSGGCEINDTVKYDGALRSFFNPMIEKELQRLFAYRKTIVNNDLKLKHLYQTEHTTVHFMGGWLRIDTALGHLLQSFGSTISPCQLVVIFDGDSRKVTVEDRQQQRKVTLEFPPVIFGDFPSVEPKFWIARDDVIYAIYHALMDNKLKGDYQVGTDRHTFPYALTYPDYQEAKRALLGLDYAGTPRS